MSKQYGLVVPNKNKSSQSIGAVKPSIFGDDSDSDTGFAKPTGLKTALKRQDRLLQEKAIEEDPTVFQYDELYDDMEAKRKESKLSRKDLDKKPKYINKLLASADRRKRENERRIERQVQKEREAEGEEFKDKESFVTSAYRAKLEELKQLDKQEEREEYLESLGDVRKQGNLDGFYRHLYDQKVLYEDKVQDAETKLKDKPDKDKLGSKNRKYRKRDDSSESDPENSTEPAKHLQHLPSNIDADSDFSIDSESDKDDSEDITGKNEKTVENVTTIVKQESSDTDKNENTTVEQQSKCEEVKMEEMPEKEEKAPKIDIWKKRTIDVVFDEALKRYFERKTLREAGTYIRPLS